MLVKLTSAHYFNSFFQLWGQTLFKLWHLFFSNAARHCFFTPLNCPLIVVYSTHLSIGSITRLFSWSSVSVILQWLSKICNWVNQRKTRSQNELRSISSSTTIWIAIKEWEWDVLMWVGSGSKFHAINIGPSRLERPRAHNRVQRQRREGQRSEIRRTPGASRESPDREKWEGTQGCETIKLLSRTYAEEKNFFWAPRKCHFDFSTTTKIRLKDKMRFFGGFFHFNFFY
jgi:hypothetical protein